MSHMIRVCFAASLTDVMRRIHQNYNHRTGNQLLLSFAASSTLADQINAGIPADIYISANHKSMDWLAAHNRMISASRHNLLGNALVLIAPAHSAVAPFELTAETNLSTLLGENNYLALGDPDHVPVGIYSKQALVSLGQWKGLEKRLARAENVRAALALVEHHEAALGIVYRSDVAIARDVKVLAQFPEDSHAPITYPVAIVAGRETPAVVEFLAWLSGDEAGAIFREYGFVHLKPDLAAENRIR